MNILIPGNLPQLSPAKVREIIETRIAEDTALDRSAIRAHCPTRLLAVRGYYRDTMGKPLVNDVGLFDDAAFLVSGTTVIPFNWNTDPSRIGWNAAIEKRFAMLAPGIWPFLKGQHKNKGAAWRQPQEDEAKDAGLDHYFLDENRAKGFFEVLRASTAAEILKGRASREWDYQAINIHWGGEYGTSSWGCQTAPPVQWREFLKKSYTLTKAQSFLPYILVDGLPS